MRTMIRVHFIFLLIFITSQNSFTQGKRAMTLEDVMKFKQIEDVKIATGGNWVVYTARPDRGDPEVIVLSSDGKKKYTVSMARSPIISHDEKWVASVNEIPALEKANLSNEEASEIKYGVALLNTQTGEEKRTDSVKNFLFSENGSYLFLHHYGTNNKGKKDKKEEIGSELEVISLTDMTSRYISFVSSFAVDSSVRYLTYILSDTLKPGNGVYMESLENSFTVKKIFEMDSTDWVSDLTFNQKMGELNFLAGKKDSTGNKLNASVYSWRSNLEEAEVILSDDDLEEGWSIYYNNQLEWSNDGMHLYVGIKPRDEILTPDDEKDSITDLFSSEEILEKRAVDVWHWNDPFINSHQKKRWKSEKDKVYKGVYFIRTGRFTPLATKEIPEIKIGNSSRNVLGFSDLPYRKLQTWDGRYNDIYLINVESGNSKLIKKKLQSSANLSPDGKFIVYYQHDNWYLVNADSGEEIELNSGLHVPFYDEDWDYPAERPGYGVAGWLERSEAVLIYDKYDIWKFSTSTGEALCLTAGKGRKEKVQFRIYNLENEKYWFDRDEVLLLSAYHDETKNTSLLGLEMDTRHMQWLETGDYNFRILKKAGDADQIVFTKEAYNLFPDLWISGTEFHNPRQLTNYNEQTDGIAWGNAELIDWLSVDGKRIQGVLIKPGNYVAGKKYPVLVYYYRFFTNMMYNFPQVVINHRPCFPYYTSNDYAIFLPDIRFDVGTPGFSATKCLVPGVQKLIDMGIADPNAIALHGHSWSGYQTAFVITQTNLFACAIAGAPVSNMTSAYSGIRWGSGLARQFQYEKSQSRIGGSLWEERDKYIENSPVFFADRIQTPLLIEFGDEDDAVPWYQGIELYLAMRRLEKDCIFLQYRGEPHHLKQYANKLDYTIKFKEYLDHYLKGEEAADWIKEGVPYSGK